MAKMAPVYFLIVDDLEDNLVSMEALLRREELVLLKARSGPAALELLLEYEVALALLDVQMPGMDGFELAELMRGMERTRSVPIIFLTAGAADYQRRFRGYEAGAVDFLQKPVEPDILKSKTQVFFDLYRQRQEVAAQRDELKNIAEDNQRLLMESQEYLKALRETDHRKDEFLATLAHELRNPLAPIRNGLALLKAPEESQNMQEVVVMMDRQLLHLVRLIDDLLDVSRVNHGKIDLKKEHVTFQSSLQAAMETSKPLIETHRHEIIFTIPDEPLWLFVDPTRMAQILSNLLNNAAKYTPEGGNIHVLANRQDDEIVVAIIDNGIGIPADMLPKIFELFTQVDNNLERSHGGLGIGLALVKQLVSMHGGTIDANSEGAGLGSVFTIHLPLAAPPHDYDQLKTQKLSTPALSQNLRILVIDDNVDSAKTTGWMLEMMGHDYKLAHDGETALIVAKDYQPNVILLDIGLPKMNGYDVCRTLRRDPVFKDTLMIAQTGWGQKKDRLQAEEAGFNHHLVKPVDFEKLSELISTRKINRP